MKRKPAVAGVIALTLIGLVAGAGGLLGGPIEFDPSTDNYIGTFTFTVAIDGITTFNTDVTSVTGLVSGTTKAGVATYPKVTVARTYQGIDAVTDWRRDVEDGTIVLRTITITQLNAAFVPVRRVVLENAYPKRWELPDMTADQAVEPVELSGFKAERVYEAPI